MSIEEEVLDVLKSIDDKLGLLIINQNDKLDEIRTEVINTQIEIIRGNNDSAEQRLYDSLDRMQ